ncbi:HAD family acid phosphatase [Amycolatopsis anabasis]|uniref:HAD family acid phosphatase n=1 Tax=Amycolatopsis anabasis TaxID=1840409 RepID=UPI00131B8D47|nr:HAD family acid phosphatase [Amycolatopsis anabasis]
MTSRIATLLLALAAFLGLSAPAASAAPALPPYETWVADVRAVTEPASAYLTERLGRPGGKPAIVLDIDNTSLETKYHFDAFTVPALPPTLDLVRRAKNQGAAVFFVTGRPDFLRALTKSNLDRVGYPVDGLYLRPALSPDPLNVPKTKARIAIEELGYTIVANIGNNDTDLVGGHAERTFKLPDYDGQLD